jgi:DNA-cytosine methyltransferase
MNVLSLFDGMSCGQIALDKLGIKVDKYFASEIDKYAMQVTQANYPNTIQVGNVEFVTKEMLNNKIDLLVGGSPCQGFSFAGKQLNFEDPRSKLFFEFVRLKNELKPIYFLLENVRMKKEHQDVISKHLGVEPIIINSRLLSAQNRNRFYWTNIPNIKQPIDKKLILKDVVEDKTVHWGAAKRGRYNKNKEGTYQYLEVNGTQKSNALTTVQKDSLVLSDKAVEYMNRLRNKKPRWTFHTNHLDGKAACLTANMFKGVPYGVIEEYCRRLTPMECERLQTVPDNYTNHVSNSQRYKMLGNGWTVDVIAHILKNIKL